MKTGYTEQAGYGLVATAKRGDRRLIPVLAGLTRSRERSAEGERLLEYGFREFQEYRLFQAGEPVREADVWLGAQPKVPLVAAETVARHPLARGAQGHGGQAALRQPGAGTRRPRASSWAALEITAPGMPPLSVPLVAGRRRARGRHARPGHRRARAT